ncbi:MULTISPECIES: hypothetical protein [unclassified Arthrobacter]|uniref:hypothetical protein n=1 Tax=unclassified Arthrobacter TaxID=235627 RepID=UPI002DFE6E58|nr:MULTISPECIES: hypothetical protein [unclassified Arthrobacter]MEC5191451.1 uncharacterized BrkB/YihY/UPF0761 family membrane protein [Arthrobacter sp. MP_M4]MEC5203034.1 uncharacterized BrkB/YihY/UPF0761 family membrane protein [Arthrobacter sp. MP_M7]
MTLGDAAQPQAVQSQRVVLDAYAFIKGWLIATTLWVGVLLLLVAAGYGVPAVLDGTAAGHVWGLLGMAILYGFGVSLVVAAPLAWVLAYCLRPVRHQWIHIGAFFAVPSLVFWLLGDLLGLGWQPWLLLPWATVGAAAAIGRWAVCKDVAASHSAADPS